MESNLISIIMPAKNAGRYLEECLNSILAQSYTNWELIVIDDHSNDNSSKLIRDYARRDLRIRHYAASGHGIVAALDQAYSYSKGLFITRMDADDVMMPNKLEILCKNLVAHGKGSLATGCVTYFSVNELGDGYQRYAEWLNDLTREGRNFQEIYKECVIPSPCWMVHRHDFELCGAFDSEMHPEDYDLCFRFYREGLNVIPCQEILHRWRDYPERTSRSHPDWNDNSFLSLKVHYFLELDYDESRPLIVWGAGKKGKTVAQLLNEHSISFQWVCNNPNKIGREIYGVELQAQNVLDTCKSPQVIVAVANQDEQVEIRQVLQSDKEERGAGCYWFC